MKKAQYSQSFLFSNVEDKVNIPDIADFPSAFNLWILFINLTDWSENESGEFFSKIHFGLLNNYRQLFIKGKINNIVLKINRIWINEISDKH